MRRCSGTGSRDFLGRGFRGLAVCDVHGIALRRHGKIDRGLGERRVALGHSHEMDGVLCGDRDRQGLRIGVADVLGREAHEPPRDVERVLAGLDHPREPIDGRVGIAVAHRLVQRGNQVVVLFAGLVVEERPVLRQIGHERNVDRRCPPAAPAAISSMLSAVRASPFA